MSCPVICVALPRGPSSSRFWKLGRYMSADVSVAAVALPRIPASSRFRQLSTWRYMGIYKWGYKSPNSDHNHSYPKYNPTYKNFP